MTDSMNFKPLDRNRISADQESPPRSSRAEFLRWATAASVSFLLGACSPETSPPKIEKESVEQVPVADPEKPTPEQVAKLLKIRQGLSPEKMGAVKDLADSFKKNPTAKNAGELVVAIDDLKLNVEAASALLNEYTGKIPQDILQDYRDKIQTAIIAVNKAVRTMNEKLSLCEDKSREKQCIKWSKKLAGTWAGDQLGVINLTNIYKLRRSLLAFNSSLRTLRDGINTRLSPGDEIPDEFLSVE